MHVLGLIFAGSATPAQKAMTTFVRDVLGLTETDAAGSSASMFVLPDGARLAVTDEREPGGGTSRTIGFEVADAQRAADELAVAGLDVDEVQVNDAYRYVHVVAPDGRLYELVQRIDPRSAELAGLLSRLAPVRRPGRFVMVAGPAPDGVEVHASVVEDDGISLVVPQDRADTARLPYELPLAWITLTVTSTLAAVGLTARVSTALAAAGIAANVIAGRLHDHVLVPDDRAEETVAILEGLAAGARPAGP